MTEPAEFTDRFVQHVLKIVSFRKFSDGRSVEEYAREISATYFEDRLTRAEGPEACAEEEVHLWGED